MRSAVNYRKHYAKLKLTLEVKFYCASVVDFRTRLEFHGERRIWDGRFIKKVIKGNSALYVFVEEDGNFGESEVVEDSGYESSIREQLGTKRSFDQITTCGELISSESPVKMSLSSIDGPAQPSPEKLPVVISTHDDPLENISSHSNLVSGLAEKSADQSDVELSNERPLMNVQQELVAPSNTILFLHNPLQQSLPMGGIPFIVFPTAGGIPVAPAPTAGNNALNTVPAQQSLEMPILPTSNNPGLQTALQASTLTPQLQSLHSSSASSQQPQNIVTSEASLLGSFEALTTVDTTEISQQLSLTGAEGDRTDLEGGQQETENLKSPDQEEPNVEKTDSSQVPEKESAEAIAVAGDQESSGLATLQMSDIEPKFKIGVQHSFKKISVPSLYFIEQVLKQQAMVLLISPFPMSSKLLLHHHYDTRKQLLSKLHLKISKSLSRSKLKIEILTIFNSLHIFILQPLPSEDSGFGTSEKLEENTSQAIHVALAGAATRGDTYAKNVMLLKNEELAQRDGKILMPTTIEMARMRKTGQYKKQVQFSKSMSEDAVRKKIQETFAFDLSVRFYCASISNTDSTLQFHGDPRVWDGKTIRRILKGNSALYIVMPMPAKENGLEMLSKVASAVKGGSSFVLVFGQALPPEVESARADFGMKTVAGLKRINTFNLIGRIPASDAPGKVIVTVHSSTGRILGKTDFYYYDRDRETLLRLVREPKLQSEFFCHWADFMVDKTK
ncbi:uncharacterized protein LOC113687112, partial [Pocillopora damicornis]|uniref:uncharacterized protein LOC113687112 n=1 Tax=Pocillopora damicornis TaxID=46731 RepID=UPI000F54E9B2